MDDVVSIYDPAGLEALRRRLRLDPRVVNRLRSAWLRSFAGVEGALSKVPEGARPELATGIQFHTLAQGQIRHSERDGASKVVLGARDGSPVESVILRIQSGRSSVCISTQTGCAGGCLFCATGRLKGCRNLTVAELLDQVVQAGELLRAEGRRLRNVVFMGMGEPFHNEENLCAALDQLCAQDGFHLSARHIMVSTVGIPGAVRRFAARFPKVGLAISLHSVRQDIRNTLMPLTRRWPLAELHAAIREINAIPGHQVMIEYLMLDGMTDTPADEAALVEWLAGLRVHVNLIPYNAVPRQKGDGNDLRGSSEKRMVEFLAGIKKAGFRATLRRSLGSDIHAACGQLAQTG